MTSTSSVPSARIPFYRNTRVLAVLAQILFALVVLGLFWLLFTTMQSNLRRQGIPISFAFLWQPAGFSIAEGLPFDPAQSYLTAFGVGVVNTLRVAVLGIVCATLLGLALGVARLAPNWLVARLATLYIEMFRSVPLLLWLIFTYAAIRTTLPQLRQAPSLLGGSLILSNRGLALVWVQGSATYDAWRPWLYAGLVLGLGLWAWRAWQGRRAHGVRCPTGVWHGLGLCGLVWVLGFLVVWATATVPPGATFDRTRALVFADHNRDGEQEDSEPPLVGMRVTVRDAAGEVTGVSRADGSVPLAREASATAQVTLTATAPVLLTFPFVQGFNYRGGLVLSAEFAALLFGLVAYTAAFIAEIVRAGIMAVPRGQREAAKALGLSDRQTFVLVILPQALRVMLPPLISQYLNLTKNSSLAIAVGYPDLFSIGLTINNQTGQAIPFVVMIMVAYLSMSVLTSLLLNRVNRRLALKTV